jgi:hypothetical protein
MPIKHDINRKSFDMSKLTSYEVLKNELIFILMWFNNFLTKSQSPYIFYSFGSETFLNVDQINELAAGLELIGFTIYLVLNFPSNMLPKLNWKE